MTKAEYLRQKAILQGLINEVDCEYMETLTLEKSDCTTSDPLLHTDQDVREFMDGIVLKDLSRQELDAFMTIYHAAHYIQWQHMQIDKAGRAYWQSDSDKEAYGILNIHLPHDVFEDHLDDSIDCKRCIELEDIILGFTFKRGRYSKKSRWQ